MVVARLGLDVVVTLPRYCTLVPGRETAKDIGSLVESNANHSHLLFDEREVLHLASEIRHGCSNEGGMKSA